MTAFRPAAVLTMSLRVDEMADTAPLRARTQEVVGAPTSLLEAPSQELRNQPLSLQTTARATERPLSEQLTSVIETLHFVNRQPDSFFDGGGSREFFIRDLEAQREDLLDRMTREATSSDTEQGASGQRPNAVAGTPPDDNYVRAGIVPLSVKIEKNSFRVADTATFTLDWKDVPFDPRLVRACGVDAYVGLISAGDYARGIVGNRGERGQLQSMLTANADNAAPGFCRFFGFVDSWTIQYDGSDGDTVTLECRDLTCLFIDTPLATGTSINLDKPIDEGIQEFIDGYPKLARIPVRFGNFGTGTQHGPPPNVGQSMPPQTRARRGRRARQTRSGDQKMSVWDHITDVCVAAGFVPIVRGTELRIIDPRTLYLSSNPDTQTGRKMVYGRNLEGLQFSRKLQNVTTPTIEVRCYDPSIGRTRWARWPVPDGAITSGILGVTNPPAPSRTPTPTPSGSQQDEQIQTYNVRAISDPVALARVARSLFEQIGRQEIEGNLTTSMPFSWDVTTDLPDNTSANSLLAVEAGDPVTILTAPSNAPEDYGRLTATTVQNLSREARASYLRNLGWSEEVAQKFAQLQEAAGFQTTFRVQNARIDFDHDDGLEINIDFINYVTVREEQSPPSDAASQTRPARRYRQRLRQGPNYTPGLNEEQTQQLQSEERLRRLRDRRDQLYSLRYQGRVSQDEFESEMTENLAEEHRILQSGQRG